MCGRLIFRLNKEQLQKFSKNEIKEIEKYKINYNTTPSQHIPVYTQNKEIIILEWGFIISQQLTIINARYEELQQKKTFKNLLNHSRCVVIVQGFYEWNKLKQPYVFMQQDKKSNIYIGGLIRGNQVIILTQESQNEFKEIHHRMPFIVDLYGKWLNDSKFIDIQSELLRDSQTFYDNIVFYSIGNHINNTKNQDEKCIQSLQDYQKQLDKIGIKKFFKTKGNHKID